MAHPQAPKIAKAGMYKVLKALLDERRRGSRSETCAAVGGQVNDPTAKADLCKQLKAPLEDLEGMELVDRDTGKIRIRKQKREPKPQTDDEKMVSDFKGLIKKQLFSTF